MSLELPQASGMDRRAFASYEAGHPWGQLLVFSMDSKIMDSSTHTAPNDLSRLVSAQTPIYG